MPPPSCAPSSKSSGHKSASFWPLKPPVHLRPNLCASPTHSCCKTASRRLFAPASASTPSSAPPLAQQPATWATAPPVWAPVVAGAAAMAALQQQSVLAAAFAQAVADLVTVEKKHIVALTEIARDALRTDPQAVPSLATVITDRIVKVRPGPLSACYQKLCCALGVRAARRSAASPGSRPSSRRPGLPRFAGPRLTEAAGALPSGQHLQAGWRAVQGVFCVRAAGGEAGLHAPFSTAGDGCSTFT